MKLNHFAEHLKHCKTTILEFFLKKRIISRSFENYHFLIPKSMGCTRAAGWPKITWWLSGRTKTGTKSQVPLSLPFHAPTLPPSANITTGFQIINIKLAEETAPGSQSLMFLCMTGNCATQKHKPLGIYVETLNSLYSFNRETMYMM